MYSYKAAIDLHALIKLVYDTQLSLARYTLKWFA